MPAEPHIVQHKHIHYQIPNTSIPTRTPSTQTHTHTRHARQCRTLTDGPHSIHPRMPYARHYLAIERRRRRRRRLRSRVFGARDRRVHNRYNTHTQTHARVCTIIILQSPYRTLLAGPHAFRPGRKMFAARPHHSCVCARAGHTRKSSERQT